MSKLYFSINKGADGQLCDQIFESKTKTSAKNELRDRGFIPKIILCWDDVEKIKNNEFQHIDMNETYQNFVCEHFSAWEQAKNQ